MLIYKATNIQNNKVYIGQTIKPLSHRISEHKCRAAYADSHTKFYNAIKKYDWENFVWEVIEESNEWTQDKLNAKEQYYIELYDSIQNGYNTLIGGQCSAVDGNEMAVICGSEPFYAFNIKGELLGEFVNKRDFARQYNIDVQRVVEMVQNKTLSTKNIIVIDKATYTPELLQYRLKHCIKKLPFVAINKKTGEKSKIFTSIEECKKEMGLPVNCHIGEVLKGSRKSSNGYIFKYVEE